MTLATLLQIRAINRMFVFGQDGQEQRYNAQIHELEACLHADDVVQRTVKT